MEKEKPSKAGQRQRGLFGSRTTQRGTTRYDTMSLVPCRAKTSQCKSENQRIFPFGDSGSQ